jgi:protein SCO1/2
MEPRSPVLRRILVALVILIPGVVFVWIGRSSTHHFETLDHYGPKRTEKVVRNGDTITDTIYHKVPDLRFVDRNGDERRLKSLGGKAVLIEFFQKKTVLKRLAVEFKGIPSIRFLSLLPDTSMNGAELRQYTDHIGADSLQWTFGRAPMERIEQFAIEGCFKGAASADTIERLIRKHPIMVLLDRKNHVRGTYEGPHSNEVERAIDEIRLLMKEMDKKQEPS